MLNFSTFGLFGDICDIQNYAVFTKTFKFQLVMNVSLFFLFFFSHWRFGKLVISLSQTSASRQWNSVYYYIYKWTIFFFLFYYSIIVLSFPCFGLRTWVLGQLLPRRIAPQPRLEIIFLGGNCPDTRDLNVKIIW